MPPSFGFDANAMTQQLQALLQQRLQQQPAQQSPINYSEIPLSGQAGPPLPPAPAAQQSPQNQVPPPLPPVQQQQPQRAPGDFVGPPVNDTQIVAGPTPSPTATGRQGIFYNSSPTIMQQLGIAPRTPAPAAAQAVAPQTGLQQLGGTSGQGPLSPPNPNMVGPPTATQQLGMQMANSRNRQSPIASGTPQSAAITDPNGVIGRQLAPAPNSPTANPQRVPGMAPLSPDQIPAAAGMPMGMTYPGSVPGSFTTQAPTWENTPLAAGLPTYQDVARVHGYGSQSQYFGPQQQQNAMNAYNAVLGAQSAARTAAGQLGINQQAESRLGEALRGSGTPGTSGYVSGEAQRGAARDNEAVLTSQNLRDRQTQMETMISSQVTAFTTANGRPPDTREMRQITDIANQAFPQRPAQGQSGGPLGSGLGTGTGTGTGAFGQPPPAAGNTIQNAPLSTRPTGPPVPVAGRTGWTNTPTASGTLVTDPDGFQSGPFSPGDSHLTQQGGATGSSGLGTIHNTSGSPTGNNGTEEDIHELKKADAEFRKNNPNASSQERINAWMQNARPTAHNVNAVMAAAKSHFGDTVVNNWFTERSNPLDPSTASNDHRASIMRAMNQLSPGTIGSNTVNAESPWMVKFNPASWLNRLR